MVVVVDYMMAELEEAVVVVDYMMAELEDYMKKVVDYTMAVLEDYMKVVQADHMQLEHQSLSLL